MIFLIAFLLLAESARQEVSCDSLGGTGNEDIGGQLRREFFRQDDNTILDSMRGRDTKPSSLRSKRDLERTSNSTEASRRLDYERAINQTVSDYHTQRKAVMDRYYARQREIVEKFARKTSKFGRDIFSTTVWPTTSQEIFENRTSVAEIESTTEGNYEAETRNQGEDNGPLKAVSDERETDREEKNNSSAAWFYRSSNWNSRDLDSDSDIDLEPESSNALERRVNRTVPINNYYKLGDFRHSKDEKIVYQHNLGVGLKGSSQLDATFEAVIEGPYEITVVEAFPYANTRANFTWLSGGPGSNFVKLKLNGFENEGFSYTVKVWGIPKKASQ